MDLRAYMQHHWGAMNTPSPSAWPQYVERVSGTTDRAAIGKLAGLSASAASRWMTGATKPTQAGNVAHFAQECGRNPVEAFVAAGLLDLDDTLGALGRESLDLLAEIGIEPSALNYIAEAARRRPGRTKMGDD